MITLIILWAAIWLFQSYFSIMSWRNNSAYNGFDYDSEDVGFEILLSMFSLMPGQCLAILVLGILGEKITFKYTKRPYKDAIG